VDQELTNSTASSSSNNLKFIATFDAMSRRGPAVPAWVENLRQPAMDRFLKTGLPNLRHEEWKYTSLRPLSELTFSYPEADAAVPSQFLSPYLRDNEINLVFVDGKLSSEFARMSTPGVTIKCLSEALQQDSEKVRVVLEEFAKRNSSSLADLNQAFLSQGSYIEIAKNTAVKPVINIVHVAVKDDQTYAIFPTNIIVMEQGSEATVVETFLAANEGEYFVNAAVNVSLKESARLRYYKIQAESAKAFHVCETKVTQESHSHFEGFNLDVGSRLGRNNLDVILKGQGAHVKIDGLYLVLDAQHIDNHTAIDHAVPHCTSSQLYKGILKDGARAVFNGKVFVRRDAQQTAATQMNRNLLLGKRAEIDTKPELQIDADDVKVTHGAAVGQLDAEELFYLQSRGIPRQRAEEILGRAFVDELINSQEPVAIREKLRTAMERFFERAARND
jgi:Fe-S cluster assembly protein SufD